MPRGDGTGPASAGPMTGRGAGFCATPADATIGRSFLGRGFRRGAGRGFGRGIGRGLGFRGAGRGPRVFEGSDSDKS